jgi:hypothetical protein
MSASIAAKNVYRKVSRGQSRSPIASIMLATTQTARITKTTRGSIVKLILRCLGLPTCTPWSESSTKYTRNPERRKTWASCKATINLVTRLPY